jgi:hypothetical protein
MLAEVGPRRTLINVCRRVRDRLFPQKYPPDPFDLKFGVDTGGFVEAKRLVSGHPHDGHSVSYWGTATSLFQGAIARWSESLAATPCTIRDYSLIDMGCGKGRVVMLASDFPFQKVIGVELSPMLVSIAQQNLAKWRAMPHLCEDIGVLQADVLEVPFPESAVLVYVFNPFDAHLTQLLLDRLQTLSRSRSAPIDIIYMRPEYAELFDRVPNMHLLWSGDVPFSPEDAAADLFRGSAQGCFIYRLGPH